MCPTGATRRALAMAVHAVGQPLRPMAYRAIGSCVESKSITVSESRLQELLRAEIGQFALMSPRQVTLKHILSTSTLEQVAELIHTQLPWHMASRIMHIEAMPHWVTVPEFIEVHAILSQSFKNLRWVGDQPGQGSLVGVIQDLRKRHKAVVPLLGSAVGTLRAGGAINATFANQWLDTFLRAKVGTDMLTAHFMGMHTHRDKEGSSVVGIVDSRCNPGEICRQVAAKVSKDAEYSSVPINVESHVCSASGEIIEFSFLPNYLALIVEELLKNSAAATIRQRSLTCSRRPWDETIHVIVAADQRDVKIQVSDRGGGVPASARDKVWSYSLSKDKDLREVSSRSDPSSWADPLSGLGGREKLGMGLPLSKLYTEYLGGSLELMSLTGVGLDTYLSLNRIDASSADNNCYDKASCR